MERNKIKFLELLRFLTIILYKNVFLKGLKMTTFSLIIGLIGMLLIGFFAGLGCSNSYHENETKNRIQSGLFEYKGKAYEVKETK